MSLLAFLMSLLSPMVLIRAVQSNRQTTQDETEEANAGQQAADMPVGSDDAPDTIVTTQAEPIVSDIKVETPATSKPIVKSAELFVPQQAAAAQDFVPVVAEDLPEAPVQSGTPIAVETPETPISLDGSVDVVSGRVATLTPQGDNISEVKIVSDVAHGNITVNPDNTFALTMTQSDFIGQQSFQYEATHSDGSTTLHEVQLNVEAGLQEGGWATGEQHYMLETDDNDRVIVEHGENHQKVFISADGDALSRADIAAIEGVSVNTVTGQWLAAKGGYGDSADNAVDADIGMDLWRAVTPKETESSNWLLFERGYEYDDLGRLMMEGTNGESALNPNYIGAYGEGSNPQLNSEFFQFQESSEFLVVQDVTFTERVFFLDAKNVIFDDVAFEYAVSFQNGESITVRNSEFLDIYHDASLNGGDWEAHLDRISGLYAHEIDGLLVEGNLFDHIGWADDYNENGTEDGGQAPSQYSQNIYINYDNDDVTLRDTISMRAASFGAQVRSGGFVEDNVFLDNNAAFFTAGGDSGDGYAGQYTLFSGNLITSGAHKEAPFTGGKTMGVWDLSQMTTYVDNIVTHLADPNSDEADWKTTTHNSLLISNETFYDDTIVHNWVGDPAGKGNAIVEQNNEGLDKATLDQTTIQLFTAQLLGKEDATIADLADYLRAQAEGGLDNVVDADLINNFFQTGFGIAPDVRALETTLRFVPNELGDGVRWDNRLNWDTQDLPATREGDSVDLGGNEVVFGANTKIKALDMGEGGSLGVYGGKMELTGGIASDDNGDLNIEGSGQVWTNGTSGAGSVDIDMTGGRFVNTGETGNADLHADDGQAILATDGGTFNVTSGKTLTVESDAQVGFDGDTGESAILDLHEGATLEMTATDGDLGAIEEFRSGAFGDAPDVKSGVHLGQSTLKLDLAGLAETGKTMFKLIDVDAITGMFKNVEIDGLGDRDAEVTIDYEADSVFLELTTGNGNIAMNQVGDGDVQDPENAALWDELTQGHGTYDDEPLTMEEPTESMASLI